MNIFKCTFLLVIITKFSAAHNFEFNIILHNLITAIEVIVNYYDKNLINFNVDGIFGLQILKGEISYALMSMDMDYMKLMKETSQIDSIIGGDMGVLDRLSRLKHHVHNLSVEADIHLKFHSPDYYNKMKYFITNEWTPKVRFRTVRDMYQRVGTSNNSLFDEDTSDLCLSEIIKYITSDIPEMENCIISKKCLNVLLLPRGLTAYLITHQVLYSTLIQKSNCLFHVNNIIRENNTSVDELQNEFCSRIFNENKRLFTRASLGGSYRSIITIPIMKQDLFLEQVFVCGTIGFMDFINLSFLSSIISWISESGCFKTMDIPVDNITLRNRRHILEEVVMFDQCLAHKTSLGLAVLSTYLRLFFNPYIPSVFKKDFNIVNSIKEERVQFQKRNLPKIELDSMSMYDAYIYGKKNIDWKPYFEPHKTVFNQTIAYSEVVSNDYSYFYITMIIIFSVVFFVCLRKFKKCIRSLIKI